MSTKKTTQPIHVPTATHAAIKRYAVVHVLELGAATAELVTYALDRKEALARYEEKRTKKKKAKAKR